MEPPTSLVEQFTEAPSDFISSYIKTEIPTIISTEIITSLVEQTTEVSTIITTDIITSSVEQTTEVPTIITTDIITSSVEQPIKISTNTKTDIVISSVEQPTQISTIISTDFITSTEITTIISTNDITQVSTIISTDVITSLVGHPSESSTIISTEENSEYTTITSMSPPSSLTQYKTEVSTFVLINTQSQLVENQNDDLTLISIDILKVKTDHPSYIPTNVSIDDVINSFNEYFKDITNPNISLDNLVTDFISAGGDNYLLKQEELNFQIVPADKQNETEDLSVINLGECETILRRIYQIGDDEPLIIVKVDFHNTGYLAPKVEYEVFNPISLEKLDLEVCNEIKIDILVPVSLKEEDLFKYNTSSEYYNDLCFAYTTDEGTDIILDDRQNEYIDNNMSLCTSNCEYTGYNIETKKAICNCQPKTNITFNIEIDFNKQDILVQFLNYKNRINLNAMKCYKLLFSKKGLIENIGSYILLSINFVDIVIGILFAAKGFVILTNQIKFVRTMLRSYETIKQINDNINIYKPIKKTKSNKKIKGNKTNNKISKNKQKEKSSKKAEKDKKGKKKPIKNESAVNFFNPNKKKSIKKKIKIIENTSNDMAKGLIIKYFKNKKINNKNNKQINQINQMNVVILPQKNINQKKPINRGLNNYKYNDYEINNLLYEQAQILVKRTYFQYYFSLLKRKQILIFTFCTSSDYNSRYIKLCLFFFTFSLFLTINTLFFDDSTKHQIYQD